MNSFSKFLVLYNQDCGVIHMLIIQVPIAYAVFFSFLFFVKKYVASEASACRNVVTMKRI